jgi:hypothetical protein
MTRPKPAPLARHTTGGSRSSQLMSNISPSFLWQIGTRPASVESAPVFRALLPTHGFTRLNSAAECNRAATHKGGGGTFVATVPTETATSPIGATIERSRRSPHVTSPFAAEGKTVSRARPLAKSARNMMALTRRRADNRLRFPPTLQCWAVRKVVYLASHANEALQSWPHQCRDAYPLRSAWR